MVLRFLGMESIYQKEKKLIGWENRFQSLCKEIETKKLEYYDNFYTDIDSIYKANQNNKQGVNIDGFRGKRFVFTKTLQKKVLLIGDSFTWGSTAIPITDCFADILDREGYHIFNAGIPGTDPIQYAKIAEKYTGLLKPDVVGVCVYAGNDLTATPQLVEPGKNLHYSTNYGFLKGYDDYGNYFSNVEEAFAYLKIRKCGHCSNGWDYFLFKTVLGGKIYSLIHRKSKLIFDKEKKWIIDSMKRIQDVCQKYNARMMIFFIPFKNEIKQKTKSIKKNLHLFNGFEYYIPGNLKKTDYRPNRDNHFNNEGHRKFADFIKKTLTEKGYPPMLEVSATANEKNLKH